TDAESNRYITEDGYVLTGECNEAEYTLLVQKGEDGMPGKDGQDGLNGADGVNGTDGTGIVWKGTLEEHPLNPENGWAYRNSVDKKTYIYQDGQWYQMTIDGVDGQNGAPGKDGIGIVWKGDMVSAPANPQKNWVYRDTDNGRVYIYNGTTWELMVVDGSDGMEGAPGQDGLSVYITYHDSVTAPLTPTGNGTTGGWHHNATESVRWMSQKV
ncbi:OmpA/MotB domain protein, partial [gut metagenome]